MKSRQPAKRNIVFLQLAIVVFVLALIIIITGAILIAESQKPVTSPPEDGCKPSAEAERVGLFPFLQKVENAYYSFRTYKIGSKPKVSAKEIREIYAAYDPTPSVLKRMTDYSLEYLKEINETKSIDEDQLKPRERRMLAQVKQFLEYTFGSIYEGNFYNGDFMLGPNVFCDSPICQMGNDFQLVLPSLKPSSIDDVRFLRKKLLEFNTTVNQYISNLKLGVRTGFVRSIHSCKGGLEALRTVYPHIFLEGENGVVNETFAKRLLSNEFTSQISSSIDNDWKKETGISVNESLRRYMIEYVGRPFALLFRYLKTEHMVNCLPDNEYSGLAKLPVPFVYVNGTKSNQRTTEGELQEFGIRVSGKALYHDILRFFTTRNETPDAVYDLGWKMLDKIYPQIIDIAKNVTATDNNNTAKTNFLVDLARSKWTFEVANIPQDESNEEAQRKCIDMKTAQQYCGKRLEAVKKWMDDAVAVMGSIEPKTTGMFHFAGNRTTTPNCPVVMKIDFNPAMGVQSYRPTNALCTSPAGYLLPFWRERPGPSYEEYGVNSQEARPGHHTQVMGYLQNFEDNCGTPLNKLLNNQLLYQAFIEGWGLYSESPLVLEDTDVYENIPEPLYYRYGTLKWQILRAIRLIIDTGLHSKGFSRDWALQLMDDRAWDNTDVAKKEVTRYQSVFGQATAYMVGQQKIIALRHYAKQQLKEKFNIRDFHFFLLYQGGVPLDHLQDTIERYVNCIKDDSQKGCSDVLDPLKRVKAGINYSEFSSFYEGMMFYA